MYEKMLNKIFRFRKQSASFSELEGLFCEAKNVALCVLKNLLVFGIPEIPLEFLSISNERNHLLEVEK